MRSSESKSIAPGESACWHHDWIFLEQSKHAHGCQSWPVFSFHLVKHLQPDYNPVANVIKRPRSANSLKPAAIHQLPVENGRPFSSVMQALGIAAELLKQNDFEGSLNQVTAALGCKNTFRLQLSAAKIRMKAYAKRILKWRQPRLASASYSQHFRSDSPCSLSYQTLGRHCRTQLFSLQW
jgi:hypothetical protein